MMNPQTREQDYGALRIDPDINHIPYPEDMEDIAYQMYDPNLGVKLISQYMQQAYEYYSQVDDLQGENARLRSKLDKLEDVDIDTVQRLERQINDLKKNNKHFTELLSEASHKFLELKKDFDYVEDERDDALDKASTAAADVVKVAEELVKNMAKHMREPGMRDIDELWVETSKIMAMDALNQMSKLRERGSDET